MVIFVFRLCMAAFCVGIIIVSRSSVLTGNWCNIVLITAPLWFFIVKFFVDNTVIKLSFSVLCALGVGIGFAGIKCENILKKAAPVPVKWSDKAVFISGMITGLPSYNKGLWRFTLTDVHVEDKLLGGSLKLSWYSRNSLSPGQCWKLLVRVKPPHSTVSPGAFEMEAWLRRAHINGTGYVVKSAFNRCTGSNHLSIDFWRNKFNQHLIRMLPGKDTQLSQALLFGKKAAVSPEDWALFNATGTTHLLIISGLHVGLIFMFGYSLISGLRYLRLLPLKYVALPRVGVIFGFLMGCLYAALAGFSVPVQRALTMLFFGCLNKLFDFNANASTVWLTAMTGILLFDPMAVTSNGFWYSFIAVASLLLVFANKAGGWSRWQRLWLPQWSVFIALFPLLLWYQQPSAWCSPIINMLSVPFVGLVVVPLLMAGMLISFLPGEINWILSLGNCLLQYWKSLIQWVASWSVISQGNSIINATVLLLSLAGACFFLLPRGLGWRWLGVPCLLLIWLPDVKKIAKNQAEIALLDVRRSHVAIIRTRHHVAIFDMGDRTKHPRFNTTQTTILPFLHQHKINTIDAWILPRGLSTEVAASQLKENVTINKIYSSARFLKEDQLSCENLHSWQWDGVVFQLFPDKNSCILTVTSAQHRVLFTGNASGTKIEYLLKKHYKDLHSDVWCVMSVKPYLPEIKPILQNVAPNYIALSQSEPLKVMKEKKWLNSALLSESPAQKLIATADTGTQYYLLQDKGDLAVSFSREKDKRWWRY